MQHGIIIIGAGPAGIGCALALNRAGIKDILIIEADCVGESFRRYPSLAKTGKGEQCGATAGPDASLLERYPAGTMGIRQQGNSKKRSPTPRFATCLGQMTPPSSH